MGKKTKIIIDYSKCGDGIGADPRDCCKCLRTCKPAVFLLHQTLGVKETDPYNPSKWRVTPQWPSLCTHCMNCINECPQSAIKIG